MSTYLKYNLSFESLIDTPNEILAKFLKDASREEIIMWLSWNDRNGIYTDKESLKEFGIKMSKKEGIEIMKRQIEENR
jgi:hypothetical protein